MRTINITDFEQRIINTVANHCKITAILLVIILLLLAAELLYYRKTKSNEGVTIWVMLGICKSASSRFSLRDQILLKAGGIILLLGVMLGNMIPAYKDISQKQYMCVSTIYSNDNTKASSGWLSNGYIYIEVDGEKLRLELPYGWTTEEFPAGSFPANVYYGKDTMLVLKVEQLQDRAHSLTAGQGTGQETVCVNPFEKQ